MKVHTIKLKDGRHIEYWRDTSNRVWYASVHNSTGEICDEYPTIDAAHRIDLLSMINRGFLVPVDMFEEKQ